MVKEVSESCQATQGDVWCGETYRNLQVLDRLLGTNLEIVQTWVIGLGRPPLPL
jgi:hypothetical protein